MTSCCWLVVMDSERFASLIQGIFCGGLNAYCMHIRPLFLRTSGSSGVLKALLLERNGQLSCNPKKKKKKKGLDLSCHEGLEGRVCDNARWHCPYARATWGCSSLGD